MVPAEGLLGATCLALRAAVGRPPSFNLGCAQVVEPFLFYVGGSTE